MGMMMFFRIVFLAFIFVVQFCEAKDEKKDYSGLNPKQRICPGELFFKTRAFIREPDGGYIDRTVFYRKLKEGNLDLVVTESYSNPSFQYKNEKVEQSVTLNGKNEAYLSFDTQSVLVVHDNEMSSCVSYKKTEFKTEYPAVQFPDAN